MLLRPSRVNGRFQANSLDCLPGGNIKPFGVCAISHGSYVPVMPFWTGAHAWGAPSALGWQQAARQQSADDRAHAESAALKEEAAKVAVFGLACALVGIAFPPLEIVAAAAMYVSEALLVAAVAEDTLVALDHPTQDNWTTVGGDVVAIATGYVVGKILAGPVVRGIRSLLGREVGAEASTVLPKTEQEVAHVLQRGGVAADDELASEAAARQGAAQQTRREAERLAAEQAKADKITASKRRTPEELEAEAAAKKERKESGERKKRLIDEENKNAQAAKHDVPYQPSRTLPSGKHNPNAKPSGPPAKIKGNAEQQRSLHRENEAVRHAAEAGYRVEQNPPVPGTKNPDYRIENKIFDCYSPKSERLDNIGSGMAEKVNDEQARRLLLNLDDAPHVQVEDIRILSRQLQQETANPKLEEVLVWKEGQFHHVFP